MRYFAFIEEKYHVEGENYQRKLLISIYFSVYWIFLEKILPCFIFRFLCWFWQRNFELGAVFTIEYPV